MLEVLNDVVKYAHARGPAVSLGQTDGVLTFEVRDAGHGFDTAGSTHGTAL